MTTIKGTNGPDRLVGNASTDFILGLGESDTIRSGSHNMAIINSGSGDDVIFNMRGNDDLLIGGAGGDEFHLGRGRVSVYAGKGNDNVLVGTNDEFLEGGKGQDTLSGLGARSSYTIATDENGYTHITNAAGVEIVEKGFETLDFAPEPVSTNSPTNNSINPPTNISTTPPPVTTPPPATTPPPVVTPPAGGGGGGGGAPTPPPPGPMTASTGNPANVLTDKGTYMFGDGTTPAAANAQTSTSADGSISLTTAVVPRQELHEDSYAPTSTSMVGNVLIVNTNGPSGPERKVNDSQNDIDNRGATNVIEAFGAPNGVAEFITGGGKLTETYIGTDGTKTVLTGVIDPNNPQHVNFLDANGNGVKDNQEVIRGGVDVGSDNSEQINFFPGTTVASLVPGAKYEIDLDAFNANGQQIAGVHQKVTLV